jgi:APA family basic amino acid/polyamine antiporter
MSESSSARRPALPRRLGPWGASALVASNMLGVGAFASTGLLAEQLGDPLLVLAVWVAVAGGFVFQRSFRRL